MFKSLSSLVGSQLPCEKLNFKKLKVSGHGLRNRVVALFTVITAKISTE